MTFKIGMIIEGTITGLQPYGAFVALDQQTQGLIHVSEVQAGYTKNINALLEVGQKVTVQVIDIDEYSQKISLSLRTLQLEKTRTASRKKIYHTNKNHKIGFASLEDELPAWINEAMDELLAK